MQRITCGILIRVSSAQQADSIEKQEFLGRKLVQGAAREMAVLRGVACVADVPDWAIYKDIMSGTRRDRPDYRRLINDIRAGKLDVVVVRKVNRIARNLSLNLELKEALEEAGCVLMEAGKNGFYDFSNPDDLRRFLSAGVEAQVQSAEISQMARLNHEFNKAHGLAPYVLVKGFKRSTEGKMEENPDDVGEIKVLVDTFLKDKTYAGTARKMNQAGYSWSIPGVKRWLEHPSPRGHTRYEFWADANTELPENQELIHYRRRWMPKKKQWLVHEIHLHTHPPLLSADEFKAIDRIIGSKRTGSKSKGAAHPLAGKVFCSRCGARADIVPTTRSRNNGDSYIHKRFYCSADRRYKGVKGCGLLAPATGVKKRKNNVASIPYQSVEEAVIEKIITKKNSLLLEYSESSEPVKTVELIQLEEQLHGLLAIPATGNQAIVEAIAVTRGRIEVERSKISFAGPSSEDLIALESCLDDPNDWREMPDELKSKTFFQLVESIDLLMLIEDLDPDMPLEERIQVHLLI